MTSFRRLAAACLGLCLLPSVARSASTALDFGLRASIYDENYKAGVGAELGAILPASADWDLGLHLNYSHFAKKTESWDPAEELGGYVGAYFKPKFDQAFWLRIGPHIGYSHIRYHYLDIGGDVMAVFAATPKMDFYAAIVPSYMAIGKMDQSLIRIGIGLEYKTGN